MDPGASSQIRVPGFGEDVKKKNCVFYKLGGKAYGERLDVDCENCIFVDSNIEFNKGKKSEFDERVWFKEENACACEMQKAV